MSTQTGPVSAAQEQRTPIGGPERASIDPHQARREPEQRLLSFHTPGTQHRDALTVEIHR